VILPKTSDELGMLSFQHGTIVTHEEAPTETPTSSGLMLFYSAMASPGFIGVVPDFFGFGSSKSMLHPYYIESATADAVVDNLKAARELALLNDRKFNGRLFLAGYSQGGYATMAAHKSIEASPLDDFDLIASFPASGGYDIKGVQEYFFEQTTYSQPYYLAYVAFSYKTYLNWTEPLTDFFNEPYASLIPTLFGGNKSGSEINAQLTQDVSQYINPELIQGIDTEARFEYIVDAFEENSVNDFIPTKRLYLYHGNLDTTVPYQNSVDVYNEFITNGASPDIVTFTTLQFATHNTGFTPYLLDFIDKVLDMK
jgi:pimeloyl-ACP methyl ester carboxylesterase